MSGEVRVRKVSTAEAGGCQACGLPGARWVWVIAVSASPERFGAELRLCDEHLMSVFDRAGAVEARGVRTTVSDDDDRELQAMGVLARALARREGEDVMGVILKTGAFHLLEDGDAAVVALGRKLESACQRASQARPDMAHLWAGLVERLRAMVVNQPEDEPVEARERVAFKALLADLHWEGALDDEGLRKWGTQLRAGESVEGLVRELEAEVSGCT